MDAKPPCELSVKYVLPAIRFIMAKKLIEEHGFTQTTVARALGTTQAAISHYMRSKRGWRWAERLMSIEEVKSLVEKSIEKIASSEKHKLDVLDICQLCWVTRKHMGKIEKS